MSEWVNFLEKHKLEDVFWGNVRKGLGSCWEWCGLTTAQGYGCFNFEGKHLLTHRLAYEWVWDRPIPVGLSILHRCDNKICVSPNCLFEGTRLDNYLDMVSKKRDRPFGGWGESHYNAKLTSNQVRRIRQMYFMENVPVKDLGRIYSISESNVYAILDSKIWIGRSLKEGK